MHARLAKKIPRTLLASTVLAHLKSCGYSAQTARCGHLINTLTACTAVCAYNCQSDQSGTLYLQRKRILLLVGKCYSGRAV